MKADEIGAEILESCRRGDRDAFRALYEAYKDRVYSIALYFFHGDAAAAADVTQQVFMKLLTGISQFRGNASFSTWLYRLVVNACVDDVRRGRARAIVTDPEVLDALPAAGSHEERYLRGRTAASVQEAVSSLPAKYRIAVLLRYFDDLSYDEMAETLGCSIGTVSSRLSRAHRLLAHRLAALNPQPGVQR
ncbi:MAG TPA: sigma-70 family RNA polymerase sigma factor [Vicinamibacterales bacterium]|nr:sigma-70 family RNA polymerase sigma factor [Vicinamibacterales bacterium]